jgi:hypothetical protein
MSRVKVKDEETGQIGYIDDQDESVPFEPIDEAAPAAEPEAPAFLSYEPPAQEPVAPPRPARSTVPYSQQQHTDRVPGGGGQRVPFTPPADNRITADESFARGAGQGLTYGYQDELSARLSDLMSEGDTYDYDLGQMRSDNREAEQAHPSASGFGIGIGSAMAPGGGTGGGAARRILTGAAEGALAGRGYSEAEDPTDDMIHGAEMGAAFPAFSAAAAPLGRGMAAAGDAMAGPIAKRFRARVPGPVPEEIASSVAKTEEYGGELQRLGIGDRPWSNSRQAAQDAEQSLARTGPEFDALHDRMDAAGVRGMLSQDQIEDSMRILGPMEPKSRNNGLFRRSMDALRRADTPSMPAPPPAAPRPYNPAPADPYARRFRLAAESDARSADAGPPRLLSADAGATQRSPVSRTRKRGEIPVDVTVSPPRRPKQVSELIDTPRSRQQAELQAAVEDFRLREGRAPTMRELHGIRMALDDVIDPTSERIQKRETRGLRGEISDVMQSAADRSGFGDEWTSANRDYRGAATAAGSAREGNRTLTNNPESSFGRALLTGAAVGMAPTAISATGGGEGGMRLEGGGGSIMSGLGTTAAMMAARGRAPRLAEAFSSVGGSAVGGLGRTAEAAAKVSSVLGMPITQVTESRRAAALNPEVARILDEALGSDQDPAVTNFKLQFDEQWRRSGVEEEP